MESYAYSINYDIGKNIRRIREERGLTQKELAEKMNLRQATLSSWEIGRTEPSSSHINQLCKILGCKHDDIFGFLVIDIEDSKDIDSMKDRLYHIYKYDEEFRRFLSNSRWAEPLGLIEKGDKT